jgi:hypothetical protein
MKYGNTYFVKKVKFSMWDGRMGRAVPCCTFKDLIQVLSQLPGQAGNILRREQAEIATMVREGKRAEVNALMDRKESKDVIVPATPEVHNPVKDLNLMNLNVEDFKDIRQEKGYFCLYDAITQMTGGNLQRSQEKFKNLNFGESEKNGFIKMVQFTRRDGRMGRAVPCCTFKDLVQVLSQLPGQAGKILRREQAEIATMVREGKRAEVNALMDREEAKDVISPETPEVHNPVKDLNIMNFKPADFLEDEDIRHEDGLFCIYDVISKVKGCSKTSSNEYASRIMKSQICDFIKMVQFARRDGHMGRAVPCCTFKDLVQVLSQLPGQAGKILRREQAEIATRAIAGDEAL